MLSTFNNFKNKLSKKGVNKFMPHEFSNYSNTGNDDTFQFLILLVERGDLLLRFKTKCSRCSNYKVLADENKTNGREYVNLYCECDKCHRKTKMTKKNVYPFFEIK